MPRSLRCRPAVALAALTLLTAGAHGADAGQQLAAICASCHGTYGRTLGNVGSLAGMPADTLVSTVAAFRSGARPSTVMGQIAKGFTDEQVRQIAVWFAAQQPTR